MPKIYSEEERVNIRSLLFKECERLLSIKSIKDITIDELVKYASIAKGSFYLFFTSKEELVLQMVKQFNKEMEERVLEMLQELDENHIVTSLTEVFLFFTYSMYTRGIYRILDPIESALIQRKLSLGALEKERDNLFKFFKELFSYFAIDDEKELEGFFNSYMLLLYSFLNAREIKSIKESIRVILRGLILQLVGE